MADSTLLTSQHNFGRNIPRFIFNSIPRGQLPCRPPHCPVLFEAGITNCLLTFLGRFSSSLSSPLFRFLVEVVAAGLMIYCSEAGITNCLTTFLGRLSSSSLSSPLFRFLVEVVADVPSGISCIKQDKVVPILGILLKIIFSVTPTKGSYLLPKQKFVKGNIGYSKRELLRYLSPLYSVCLVIGYTFPDFDIKSTNSFTCFISTF